jgi:uncharacterized protein
MVLYKNGVFGFLWRWLSRVGQMAFSNYLMQSIICVLIFYGFWFWNFWKAGKIPMVYRCRIGLGFPDHLQQYPGCDISASDLFEWLWRSITYWKKQPMKRKQEIDEPVMTPGPVPE